MLADAVDERRSSDDDAGLRSAEELVAAEAADVDAGGDRVADRRFRAEGVRQGSDPGLTLIGPVATQMAAAEILGDRDVESPAERDEIRERRPLGEPFDAEIRRMDAQDQRRPFVDRRRVIGRAGLVRRADLAQDRAGLRHHVRDAEAAADLDELAARHDDFASRRQRRQHEHRRGRVVVDDYGRLGAGEAAEQRLGMDVAPAAGAARQIVLERRVAARDVGDALDR